MWQWLRQLGKGGRETLVALSRPAGRRIPEALWRETLARYPFLAGRGNAHEDRLRQLSLSFLDSKEFHGAKGLVVTDAMALAIAAQACLPVVRLGLHWYDDFVGVVVQPGEVLAHREVTDEFGVVHRYHEVLAGEAMEQGPVMLSWPDVELASAGAEHSYNVVIHEFAHKIDMRNGLADGCPPLPLGFSGSKTASEAHAMWLAAMQFEYETFRERSILAERFSGAKTWLDPYGATSIDEFFAVACEGYFLNRERFSAEHPRLLPLFDEFFQPQPRR